MLIAILILTAVSFHNKTTVSVDDISTTAVTDAQGETHYYTPATDKNGDEQTTSGGRKVYVEIETEVNGKYSVKDNTAVFETTEKSTTSKSTTSKTSYSVSKETATETTKATKKSTEVTQKEEKSTSNTAETTTANNSAEMTKAPPSSKIATDEDGWVDKWY